MPNSPKRVSDSGSFSSKITWTIPLLVMIISMFVVGNNFAPHGMAFIDDLIHARNMADFGWSNAQSLPGGHGTPLAYACALLWLLLPSAKSSTVLVLANILSGLLCFVFLLQTGKEFSSSETAKMGRSLIKAGTWALWAFGCMAIFAATFAGVWMKDDMPTFQTAQSIQHVAQGRRVTLVPSDPWYDAQALSVFLEGKDVRVGAVGGPLFPPQGIVMGKDIDKVKEACQTGGFPLPAFVPEGWCVSRAPEVPDFNLRPGLVSRSGYAVLFGYGRGLVQGEDLVMNPKVPLAETFPENGLLKVKIILSIDQPGWYEVTPPDPRFKRVFVDGKKVGSKPIRFNLGPHEWVGYAFYEGRDDPPAGWGLKRVN